MQISRVQALLKIAIFVLLAQSTFSAQISPFSPSIYNPSMIYRTTYSVSLTGSATSSYTINYPSAPWGTPPIILYSVLELSFNRGLYYDLTIPSKNNTAMTAQLAYDSTLSEITFCFLMMDSTLYQASLSEFAYTMPAGASGYQQFVVAGCEDHDGAFLVGILIQLGPIPSGFAPDATSQVVTTNLIIRTNLTIGYDTSQLSIVQMRMSFVDFNQTAFRALDYIRSGSKFEIYGTSGIANDPYMTGSYLSMYRGNYFVGLMGIYDGQFLIGPLGLDIANSLSTKIYYFLSEILIVTYFCPTTFPITDADRQYCYSDCDVGFYYDGQYMCQPCDPNCLTCSMTAINCTSCLSPWILSYGYVCACPSTMYQVTYPNSTIQCKDCSTNIFGCQSCNSPTICTKCMNNLILSNPLTCICDAGTVLQIISGQPFCITTSIVIYQTCETNFIQVNNTCQCNSQYNLTLSSGACSPF